MSAKQRSKTATFRVIGYVRISKDRDGETSTTTQREAIETWCRLHGHELVEIVEEPGRSAFKQSRTSRPGYKRARQLLDSGAGNMLACWKLNRVARNTVDTLNLIDELRDSGAGIVAVTEPFDMTTPIGRAMVGLIAVLAELESATKSDNITAWQSHRKHHKMTPTGPRPFGYRREPNKLIVEPAEAAEIVKATHAVLDGVSMISLVADLNRRDMPTSTGKRWSHRGLRHVLMSPTTAGLRLDEDGASLLPGSWEPIIERETWDSLCALLSDPGRRTSTSNVRRWLLSGVAMCSRCNVPMGIRPNNAGPRYTCLARKIGGGCGMSIDAVKLDTFVTDALLRRLDGNGWAALRRRARAPQGEIEVLRGRLIELASQYDRGEIETYDEWQAASNGVRREIAAMHDEPIRLPEVDDIVSAWRADALDVAAQHLVVTALIERLTIDPAKPGTNGFDDSRIQPLSYRI